MSAQIPTFEISPTQDDDYSIAESPKSQTIPWKDAKELIKAYHNHSFSIPGPSGKKLKGLRLDLEDINEMCNTNYKFPFSEIIMLFAIKADENGNEQVTTIIAPIDAHNHIITDEKKVFDYCDPCPERCPSNLNYELHYEDLRKS